MYDSEKHCAFAARDSSGREPLLYEIEEDGALSLANTPLEVATAEGGGVRWAELPPGHYISGAAGGGAGGLGRGGPASVPWERGGAGVHVLPPWLQQQQGRGSAARAACTLCARWPPRQPAPAPNAALPRGNARPCRRAARARAGRTPKLGQFALTPEQVSIREFYESLQDEFEGGSPRGLPYGEGALPPAAVGGGAKRSTSSELEAFHPDHFH